MLLSAAFHRYKNFQQPEERLKHGLEQRKHLSRKEMAEVFGGTRSFDPIELLRGATEGREAKLLPVKYSRMAVSPFAFFRGAVSIMAADLSKRPHTTIMVQLCGDAHLQNLGSFASPNGALTFDINDFDETIEGPWEWDLKRMAASIVLAGFESSHSKGACAEAVEALIASYCNVIEELADQPILVAARHQIHRYKKAQAVSAALKQAERATPADLLEKYTTKQGRAGSRFKKVGDVLWPVGGAQKKAVLESIPRYRESVPADRLHLFDFFRPLDVAFKIVGTGSVGLRDYVVLMEGNGPQDALFLQIKQEVSSAYAPYLPKSPYAHQGRRVAEGQRRIQPLSDLLLGWTEFGGHHYLVRQLNDHKGSVDLDQLRGEGLSGLAAIAGELLARGHSRSGDSMMIKGFIGQPDKVVSALVQYGMEYATQTEADFEQFKKEIKVGRVKLAA